MYQRIIMPVDVFEMELSDKAVRHAEFLAQQDGVIHLLHVLQMFLEATHIGGKAVQAQAGGAWQHV